MQYLCATLSIASEEKNICDISSSNSSSGRHNDMFPLRCICQICLFFRFCTHRRRRRKNRKSQTKLRKTTKNKISSFHLVVFWKEAVLTFNNYCCCCQLCHLSLLMFVLGIINIIIIIFLPFAWNNRETLILLFCHSWTQ